MGAGRNHLGDDGYTGFLGEGRLPKSDPRIEALGALDETNSVLGLARATCHVVSASDWIIQIQRDLYTVMSEVASEPELADHFPTLKNDRLSWLDDLISSMESRIPSLQGFILPGDSFSSAILDLSRTVTRRA